MSFSESEQGYKQLTFGETLSMKISCWNIVHIIDQDNNPTNLIAVRNEFENKESEELFNTLLKTKKVIGLSSYQNFPQIVCNPFQSPNYPSLEKDTFMYKYGNHVILWCHCFKTPDDYIPRSMPSLLYSESDQYPHEQLLFDIKSNKEYDCFVSIPEGDWNNWIRGLPILKSWLNYMADSMNLKILVCGSNRRKDFTDKIDVIGFQTWDKFIKEMSRAKFLFCASKNDASPRIIIEAILLDMPVFVNQNILGGWKYINKYTGAFFNPDETIERKINQFMKKLDNNEFKPQQWYKKNIDIIKNKSTLADMVNSLMHVKWDSIFDAILYINLEKRQDRKESILNEFMRMDIPDNFIHRIDAIYVKECGHLGCTKSHLKALEYAKEKGFKNVLILEDDFIFQLPKERVFFMFMQFIKEHKQNWDVFMFTTYWKEYFNEVDMHYIKQVKYGTTGAGYLINNTDGYIDILYANLSESHLLLNDEVEKFKKNNPDKKLYITDNAFDQYWRTLQIRDRFFITEPYFGNQSSSPSTIME